MANLWLLWWGVYGGQKGIGPGGRSEPGIDPLHHLLSEFQVWGGGRKGGGRRVMACQGFGGLGKVVVPGPGRWCC